ncbi:MAG: SDR family NAD(P)-dependent oxidoreductase [Novosphingobium sp.]|uniref:SDR family NAD(P)-dependent oxidoreductase n=1 Tax=Novosphingobium sp. TaxID=1874826 RepID=UPI002733A432|nr:SDR family NAD(P)-dependent oxidoreductase [Novosphingobium sp.]MDP3552192.1 SDR family NAD(P)-dependent oxidoreductase [Novosphingobium sp.]
MTLAAAIAPGKWAFVTGGSDGLGLAFATELAGHGMNCLLIARQEDKLAAAAAAVRALGVEARTLSLDLGAPDAVAQIEAATADLPLTLAVFNAGAEASGTQFVDLPYAAWAATIQRNVLFLTEALHHFGERLVQGGGGGLIVVGSEAAFGGAALSGIYTATKGFALNLCEALWAELTPRGVDVITLLFKIADTPMLRETLARRGIPVEATGASDTAMLARGTLAALGSGPIYNPDEVSPDDPVTSNAARRERVVTKSELLKFFYG